MEDFVFQHDIITKKVLYRYAILRFFDKGKFHFGAIIAKFNKDKSYQIIGSMTSDTFEDAVFFLKESAINQFADVALLNLNQELNELIK